MEEEHHAAFPGVNDCALSGSKSALEWSSPTSVLQDADSLMRTSIQHAEDPQPFARQPFPQQFPTQEWVSVRKEGNRSPRAGISPKGSSGSSQNVDGAPTVVGRLSLPLWSSSQGQEDKPSPKGSIPSVSSREVSEVSLCVLHPAGNSASQFNGVLGSTVVPVSSTGSCGVQTAAFESDVSCIKETGHAEGEVPGGTEDVNRGQCAVFSTSGAAEFRIGGLVENVQHQREGIVGQELLLGLHKTVFSKEECAVTVTKARCPGRHGARFPPPVYKDLQKVPPERKDSLHSSAGSIAGPSEGEAPAMDMPTAVSKPLSLGRGTPPQLNIPDNDEYVFSEDSDEDGNEDELSPLGSADSGPESLMRNQSQNGSVLSKQGSSDGHGGYYVGDRRVSRLEENGSLKGAHSGYGSLTRLPVDKPHYTGVDAAEGGALGRELAGKANGMRGKGVSKSVGHLHTDVSRFDQKEGASKGHGQAGCCSQMEPLLMDRKSGKSITLRMIQHLRTMRKFNGGEDGVEGNWDPELVALVRQSRPPGLPLSPTTPSPRRVAKERGHAGTTSPRRVTREEMQRAAREWESAVECGDDDMLERQKLGWHYRRFGTMQGESAPLGRGTRAEVSDAATQSDKLDPSSVHIHPPREGGGTLEEVWGGVEQAKEAAQERQLQHGVLEFDCRGGMRREKSGNVQIWVPGMEQDHAQSWNRGEGMQIVGNQELQRTSSGPRGRGRLQNLATAFFRGCQKKGYGGGEVGEKEVPRRNFEQAAAHRERIHHQFVQIRDDVQNKPPGPRGLERSQSLSVVEKMGVIPGSHRGLRGKTLASVNVPFGMSQTTVPCTKQRMPGAAHDSHFARHTIGGPMRTRSGGPFQLTAHDGPLWPQAPAISPPKHADPAPFLDKLHGWHHHQAAVEYSCPHSSGNIAEHGGPPPNPPPMEFSPSPRSQHHQTSGAHCLCSRSLKVSRSAPSSWALRKTHPVCNTCSSDSAMGPDPCSPETSPWNQAVSPQSVSRSCGCHACPKGGGGGGSSPCEHCWISQRLCCEHSSPLWAERGGCHTQSEPSSVEMLRISPGHHSISGGGCEKGRQCPGIISACCSSAVACRHCGHSAPIQRQVGSWEEDCKEKRLQLPRLAKPTHSLPSQRSIPMAPWGELEVTHRKGHFAS